MSGASVRWEGLDAFRAQLRKLPDDLAAEGGEIVRTHAEGAYDEVHNIYAAHVKTGTLWERLALVLGPAGRYGSDVLLISRAPHAWIFEHGTETRQGAGGRATGTGAREGNTPGNRGAARENPAFIPAMVTWRTRMYDALALLLERSGLTVTRAA